MSPQPNGTYSKGPVTIAWEVEGPSNLECKVQLEFEGTLVASKTLSPGDTNWDSGRYASGDGWCEASFELQLPTPGQQGQLDLKQLVWAQGSGPSHATTPLLLATWDYEP